jgi:hypothetical protein
LSAGGQKKSTGKKKMAKDNLVKRIQEVGFDSLDSFVRTNLHYLPENKQKLFYTVSDTNINYQEAIYKNKN